ncbi:sigma-70 family RNA polymerase sigma factor [Micromonospora sp. RTGN7]|uniref:sigma-70 family RNA polymerase sigma factor n=1 Tax=Micromonospora sp. RTGN7 TaxID=3016526 RepID=UPI0029FED20A|nr:sigma-70 family RNA polymerase sigma factor [Micromonospora sp. RTGN7]
MTERVQSTRRASAVDGDRRLHDLMGTYQQPLLKYAQQLTGGDTARAEDVVQEAFLRAWTHIDRLTEDRGSVLGWLRRVVHNLVMDGYRAQKSRPAEVEIENAGTVAAPDLTTNVVNSVFVEQVLEGLWPQHRAALVETYLKGRTAAEVSAVLGVPVGTVKSRVHYAMRAVRAALADPPDLGDQMLRAA